MVELTGFELTSTPDEHPPAAGAEWIPAVVPGGVHESLLAAGVIRHPYVDQNESDVRWVEERTWWYRTTFAAAEGPQLLCLDGLDTVADLWLNGRELASHRNQHRPLHVDVSELLSEVNELLIRFSPPLEGLLDQDQQDALVAAARPSRGTINAGAPVPPRDELLLDVLRSHRRKATLSWGWDFAPRLPSLGLLVGARLEPLRADRIEGVHVVTTSLDTQARTAELSVSFEVSGDGDSLHVSVICPSGEVVEIACPADESLVSVHLDGVLPWWTHDLGEQPLYTVLVELRRNGDVLDTWAHRVGIRTIELDQTPDEEGRLFRFVLNGVPVFARGANWVPPSMLVGSVPSSTFRDLVELARDGEMTMLRIWGGGTYPPDVFFDSCDELGVLVWQDLMFACLAYPGDSPDLRTETRLEATHQVRRLRNHACLALWAGNNEVACIQELFRAPLDDGEWGRHLFHELLPQVVAEHDPATPYRPGSPWGETEGELVNGVSDGDRHSWEVWHGADFGAGAGEDAHFSRYTRDTGRFISEFGIHAAPELSTLERWTSLLDEDAFERRNKDIPRGKGLALMALETGLPSTLAEYVDLSMACQAEGLKHGVEHYRRRQPQCSGTLVWQLNDPWPGLSWSVIDHDLVPKAGYYFLQRAFRPVLASFTAEEGLELWVTSSATEDRWLDLVVDLIDLRTGASRRDEITVPAPAHSSEPVWSAPLPQAHEVAWVTSPSGAIEPNRRFFAPLKDLALDGSLDVDVERTGASTARVHLTSRGYSYFAHVLSPHPGARFTANYLDLRDGESRTIDVSGLRPGAVLEATTYRRAPQLNR